MAGGRPQYDFSATPPGRRLSIEVSLCAYQGSSRTRVEVRQYGSDGRLGPRLLTYLLNPPLETPQSVDDALQVLGQAVEAAKNYWGGADTRIM